MSQRVLAAGVELEVHVQGVGTPVLLIHDMADGPERMGAIAAGVDRPARTIAYARRGYRSSGAPEPYAGTTVAEQAEDAAALLRALDAAGAVAFGEGFGALIALDLLLRHGGLLRAAVLCDPPLHAFAPQSTRDLAQERGAMEEAIALHGPQAGVSEWLRCRPGRDEELARRDHRGFYADYAGLASLPLTRAQLRAVSEPIVLLTGPHSPTAARLAADAVAGLPPRAERREDGERGAALASLL